MENFRELEQNLEKTRQIFEDETYKAQDLIRKKVDFEIYLVYQKTDGWLVFDEYLEEVALWKFLEFIASTGEKVVKWEQYWDFHYKEIPDFAGKPPRNKKTRRQIFTRSFKLD